jgi:hypothetical protein
MFTHATLKVDAWILYTRFVIDFELLYRALPNDPPLCHRRRSITFLLLCKHSKADCWSVLVVRYESMILASISFFVNVKIRFLHT